MNIGDKIRLARKGKYTQAQLAELLGVHEVTVRRWESEKGDREPSIQEVNKLAEIFDVPVSYFVDEAISIFKNPPSGGLIDTLAKAMEKSAPAIESNVRAINFANTAKIRILPSDAKVCCGDGIFWNEENFLFENIVYIPSEELSKKSDLIGIRAEGGSMEPKIHDGDLVVFRDDIGERESVSTGDIAILNYNGRVIIRGVRARGDKVTLCALNPDYKDIEVTPDDEFIILGKVAARLAFEEITGFL